MALPKGDCGSETDNRPRKASFAVRGACNALIHMKYDSHTHISKLNTLITTIVRIISQFNVPLILGKPDELRILQG